MKGRVVYDLRIISNNLMHGLVNYGYFIRRMMVFRIHYNSNVNTYYRYSLIDWKDINETS